MVKNYDDLIKRMIMRTNPDGINEEELINEDFRNELQKAQGNKVAEYVKRAMRGVEEAYTNRTFEAGNKVMTHLKKNREHLDFKYQGSVPTNTHIKGYSDIDLVQISNEFYSHEKKENFLEAYNTHYLTSTKNRLAEVINGTPYMYNADDTLKKIREEAENILVPIYNSVDITKSKSIEVELTNPKRTVDVVTASWYKSVNAVVNDEKEEQGIQIYDKDKNKRLPVDFPFLKIKLVNKKDSTVNGRLKRMIRFLKVLKADADTDIALSSFDISSICYAINIDAYKNMNYLELVTVLYLQLRKLSTEEDYRNRLMSIDGTEPIFKGKPEKVESLKLILTEVEGVFTELNKKIENYIYG